MNTQATNNRAWAKTVLASLVTVIGTIRPLSTPAMVGNHHRCPMIEALRTKGNTSSTMVITPLKIGIKISSGKMEAMTRWRDEIHSSMGKRCLVR